MRTYVFTVKFKKLPFKETEHCNKILHAINIKEAVNKLHAEMKDSIEFLIENIYSEEE